MFIIDILAPTIFEKSYKTLVTYFKNVFPFLFLSRVIADCNLDCLYGVPDAVLVHGFSSDGNNTKLARVLFHSVYYNVRM